MKKKKKKQLRKNVGILLFNSEGKVWFGKRPGNKPFFDGKIYSWQLPQGGVDKNEDIITAAKRELYEETGIQSVKIICVTPKWLYYYFDGFKLSQRFIGQKQKWVVMLFTGNEDEINFEIQKHQEFCDWRWEEFSEVPKYVVPFKKKTYLSIYKSFKYLPAMIKENKFF